VTTYRCLMTHDAGMSAETPPRLCSVCVGTPMTGRDLEFTTTLCPLRKSLSNLRPHALGGFRHDPVDDQLQILRLPEHGELPVGARTVLHDLERVLDFAPAA